MEKITKYNKVRYWHQNAFDSLLLLKDARYWGKLSHGMIYFQLLVLSFQTQNSAEEAECQEEPERSLTLDTAVNSLISDNCGFCAFIQRVEWQLLLCLQASENKASCDHSQPEGRWDRTGYSTDPRDLIFEITPCFTDKAAALNTKVQLWGGVNQEVHLGGFYGVNRKQSNCGTRQKAKVASDN